MEFRFKDRFFSNQTLFFELEENSRLLYASLGCNADCREPFLLFRRRLILPAHQTPQSPSLQLMDDFFPIGAISRDNGEW